LPFRAERSILLYYLLFKLFSIITDDIRWGTPLLRGSGLPRNVPIYFVVSFWGSETTEESF